MAPQRPRRLPPRCGPEKALMYMKIFAEPAGLTAIRKRSGKG